MPNRPLLAAAVVAALTCLAVAAAAQAPPTIEELQARVAADPSSGGDWYALGRALQDAERYEPALEAFRKAVELRFQPGGAWMRMAQILAARGDLDGAVAELEKASQQAPVVLSLLPQIGGIPELEGDPRLARLLERAEAARHPCKTRPQSRQFDFWLGEWTVSNPQGQQVGSNAITVDLEGCVLRESWTDGYGNRGTSVNFWDPATSKWHQVWTSDNGTVTHYVGEWREGAMRFLAEGFGDADGETTHRRMTFTPNEDGSVRQLIEQSEDGESWTVGFDGLYRKAGGSS